MANRRPDYEGATIVLLGTFNPAIFQPAWLGASKIIRQEEADSATITMVNPKLTAFSADWLNLQVIAERFQALTLNSAHYQALRDVVISIFGVLEHTPIWTLGMNRDMHFKINSEEQWHQLGHILAPKETWRPIIDQPGLRSLAIQSVPSISDGIQITRQSGWNHQFK